MKRNSNAFIIYGLCAALLAASFRSPAFADDAAPTSYAPTEAAAAPSSTPAGGTLTRDELTSQIQVKAKQLNDINSAMESTKQSLKAVSGQRQTLQRQLGILNGNLSELNLSIQSDQITAQKLGLEIDALGYDLQDISYSITNKRAAIEKILVELQKNDADSGNLLLVFLRSKSLADGVSEAQGFKNLQSQLTSDIANLRDLNDAYNKKIQETNDKKSGIISHRQNLENKKAIVQDTKHERQALLAQTKDRESVYQKQLSDLEKVQEQIASEVEALDAVLRTKIDPSLLPPLKHGVLAIPVEGDTLNDITQGYGATAFAKNGYRGHWHNGVDFAASIGTAVLAAEDGTVVATGNQDAYCYRGAYGKFIAIEHKDNLVTLYGHLSRQIVAKGDTVKRGDLIGYSGKTGYATGPHLHFTVYAGPTFYMGISKTCGPMPFGGDLNPLGYL